jgi:hypothetical protein
VQAASSGQDISLMIDPNAEFVEVLSRAQEYLVRAVHARESNEREFCKRIVELYLGIARELEERPGEVVKERRELITWP